MRPPDPAFDMRSALSAEIRAAQDVLDNGFSANAVHAARVRLKRARAIARIGGVGAPGLADVFDESARAAMRLMAAAREAAALASVARDTASSQGLKAATALNTAANYLEATATPLCQADEQLVLAALKDLHALAHVWPAPTPRQIAQGAAQMIRRAERAREAGLARKHQPTRHRWRRREKERLYAAEALGAAWPGPRRRRLAARLCDALGKERDAVILLDRLTSAPLPANAEPTPKRALKALKARAKHWRKRADKLGAKLARALA